jgi:ABC-type transport system involved in cytochrome bd biosynthesis fused ATPase/permease subunit
VVPGLILGIVVGGTQLAASVALLARRSWVILLSAIAVFGMLIWIFLEMAVLNAYSWLQTLYFGADRTIPKRPEGLADHTFAGLAEELNWSAST